jgi:D-sedoheptulose 7-phosphate isomerase
MIYQKRMQELTQVMSAFFEKKGDRFAQVVHEAKERLSRDRKILVFGNGGSASQAQHFAAELVNKFLIERSAIPAISLTTDTSVLTSIANDESFDTVFSRQVEALGKKGDLALGLTTSGNSPNIIQAVQAAKGSGLFTVVFTGEGGGKVGSYPDILCDVPSTHTPVIQEVHLLLLHLLAEEVEKAMAQ